MVQRWQIPISKDCKL